MKRTIAAITAISMLAGCATEPAPNQAKVTISSNPPGAILQSGTTTGQAPKEWFWQVNGREGSTTITATWISGAKTTAHLKLYAGTSTNYTIQRPNAPGLDADIQWAIHLAQEERASQDAFAAAMRSYDEAHERARRDSNQSSQFTNCTSTLMGTSTVNTSCY